MVTHLMPEAHRDADAPRAAGQRGHADPGRRGARRRPGHARGRADRRARRDLVPHPAADEGLPRQAGGDRRGDHRRTAGSAPATWAAVDDEGYVYVEDRLKDMIISGGENIYSPEIERVLAEHPAVMEVAVIGVPDDRWGETVKAVVSLEAGRLGDRGRADRLLPRAPGAVQVPASRSTSSTRCRATPPARSSSASCASPTGRAATARRSDRLRGGHICHISTRRRV